MDPRVRTARRLLPLVAVLVVAGGSVLPVAASAPPEADLVPHGPAAAQPLEPGGVMRSAVVTPSAGTISSAARAHPEPALDTPAVQVTRPAADLGGALRPAGIEVPGAPVRAETKVVAPAPASSGTAPARAGGYRGTNHVWIPSLGINRGVSWFACSRNTALDHVVYRWGCAGANNVYLMGHASSVFRPLHDAYVSGRLRKGMQVVYADGTGRVRTYAVTFWKVVAPDGDVAWAYAAQSRPSLTLQTCVGANSAYRLVVRLVAVG